MQDSVLAGVATLGLCFASRVHNDPTTPFDQGCCLICEACAWRMEWNTPERPDWSIMLHWRLFERALRAFVAGGQSNGSLLHYPCPVGAGSGLLFCLSFELSASFVHTVHARMRVKLAFGPGVWVSVARYLWFLPAQRVT